MIRITVFILMLMVWSCTGNHDTSMIAEKFDIQGHRGCRGLMPENSIPGFIQAVNLGVTTLEMDVVITKDDQVVLSHDPFMSHTICSDTLGDPIPPTEELKWNIYEMTYKEVKRFDCGSRGHPDFETQQKLSSYKPLLKDVIKAVESFVETKGLDPVRYNIETKSKPLGDGVFHPKPEEFARLLWDVVREGGINDRVIIQSFDPRTLIAMHDIDPGIMTAMLVTNQLGFRHNLQRLDFTPTIFSPNVIFLTSGMIDFMHGEGIQVIPWTVNKKERMREVIALGVDGIITDYPNRLIDVLHEK